jgi:methyl-accepting chemotaxis protein
MTKSISTRLYLSFVVYLTLVVGLSLSCSLLLQRQHDDGLVVNLSGRQRMLTQRMTHQLLHFAALERDLRPSAEARDAVLTTMRVFETTLRALDQGGPAPLDLQMTSMRDLPQASPAVHHQIARVQDVWGPFRSQAHAILDANGPALRDLAAAHIVKHNTELLAEMDAVVILMQRGAEAKVEMLSRIQLASVALAVLITLLLFWFVHRSITTPLRHLAMASREMSLGNLHKEVPVGGPVEIANIGQSFERLRLSLRTMMATQKPNQVLDAIDLELLNL